MIKIRFDEIEKKVLALPGKYEIYNNDGIALKTGIGLNLSKGLKDHRTSRRSGLRLKSSGKRENPNDVVSKNSILQSTFIMMKKLQRILTLNNKKEDSNIC
jgi:hypothetical protein